MIIRIPSTDSVAIEQAIDANPECYVWVNGAEVVIFTGEDAEAQRNG